MEDLGFLDLTHHVVSLANFIIGLKLEIGQIIIPNVL